MNKNGIIVFFSLILLAFTLLVIILFSQRSQDIRSKAADVATLHVVPQNEKSLIAPYIRLGSTTLIQNNVVPVDIYAKTIQQSIVEAQIVVTFDPRRFVLEQKSIENQQIFPVLNVIKIEPGKVVFSLFVSDGYENISLTTEQKIATLYFRHIGGSGETEIRLERDGLEATSLFMKTNPQNQEVSNVISSVNSIRMTN